MQEQADGGGGQVTMAAAAAAGEGWQLSLADAPPPLRKHIKKLNLLLEQGAGQDAGGVGHARGSDSQEAVAAGALPGLASTTEVRAAMEDDGGEHAEEAAADERRRGGEEAAEGAAAAVARRRVVEDGGGGGGRARGGGGGRASLVEALRVLGNATAVAETELQLLWRCAVLGDGMGLPLLPPFQPPCPSSSPRASSLRQGRAGRQARRAAAACSRGASSPAMVDLRACLGRRAQPGQEARGGPQRARPGVPPRHRLAPRSRPLPRLTLAARCRRGGPGGRNVALAPACGGVTCRCVCDQPADADT